MSKEESLSDHEEIIFAIYMRKKDDVLFRNPRNTNRETFKSFLRNYMDNLDDFATVESLDTAVETLTQGLHCAFINSSPGRITKPKINKWWCRELETLKRETRTLFRRYRNSPAESREECWALYKTKRNEYSSKIPERKRDSWVNIVTKSKA